MTAADHTASSLSIRLFGPLEVCLNGDPLSPLRTHKGEWLLPLLPLRAGGHVERSWLAGTLWPASGERQAMASLRRCLTDLRRALGQEASRLGSPTPQTLCLHLEGAVVDVHAFDAAV